MTVILFLAVPASAEKYGGITALSLGTAGVGGVYYVVGAGVAELLTKKLGVSTTAEVTAGSLFNAKMLGANKMDLAIMTAEVADAATQGIAQFNQPLAIKAITTLHPGMLHMVVLESSKIRSFHELKGKKVSVGQPGSGANKTNELFMSALNLNFKDKSFFDPYFLSVSESSEAFKNGTIDATLVATGVPAAWVLELETTHPIRLISFSTEESKKISDKTPFFKPYVIKTGTYKTQKEDSLTFAAWNLLTVRADLPDDIVYDITRAFFENIATIQAIHSAAKVYSLDNVQFVNIDIHPGALKYYKEKGIPLP